MTEQGATGQDRESYTDTQDRESYVVDPMLRAGELTVGTKFDTPFELGCVAVSEPDELGNFRALDSEGVECLFHVDMIFGSGS